MTEGQTGTVLIGNDGALSWVVAGRVVSTAEVARAGFRLEGAGWKPRKLVAVECNVARSLVADGSALR